MPRRDDLETILIIGSGPIVIGQACEFDYSGNQAVRALKEEGYRVILVNPNPATVMTTPGIADQIYMEPLTVPYLTKIIEIERPDGLLATMGGQTALNLALELADEGVLERYGVEILGANREAIRVAEDRGGFKKLMTEIGLESPTSVMVTSLEEAEAFAAAHGYPIIIRPSFTLGGRGGSIANAAEDFAPLVRRALRESPASSALIEESLLGWQEFELEVMRDRHDNAVVICSIENIDPMGVHTGDSITVAPAQTLSDREYQTMRDASIRILRAVGVECGGSNVQFAMNLARTRMVVIEMNPRVSRSSALASKATGFPIARCSALLAVGYTLDEVQNEITQTSVACFEPALDYCAVKVPRFELDKFPREYLGTQMKAVGESLAIGRTFLEALNKAIRACEIEMEGLQGLPLPIEEIEARAFTFHPQRLFAIYTLLQRKGSAIIDTIVARTGYCRWVLAQMMEQVMLERKVEHSFRSDPRTVLMEAKRIGLSDTAIAALSGLSGEEIDAMRQSEAIHPVYHYVDTCAGEFEAVTPYFYSTYGESSPTVPLHDDAVIIIGSGPNRIGQGLEFDCCCTLAVLAYQKLGRKTIMINANPETVSTDFNVADRLYMEPITAEHVINIMRHENISEVVVQLGGQTAINLARALEREGATIVGTSVDNIHLAEDRGKFAAIIESIGASHFTQPRNGIASTRQEVLGCAQEIGYPVLLRPSFVLGGRSMSIAYSDADIAHYLTHTLTITPDSPMLIDQFLEDAFEYDIDLVADGENCYIAGILEHIEAAGVHSGDSACVFPPYKYDPETLEKMKAASAAIARRLSIKGFLNIQCAVKDGTVYILEVNPRASRTIPYLSKSSGVDLVDVAVRIFQGESLRTQRLVDETGYGEGRCIMGWAVKEAVFSFDRFLHFDPLLGPEMRSTGESIGFGADFGEAFAKATQASGLALPTHGTIYLSVNDADKPALIPIAKKLSSLGFDLAASSGTAAALRKAGLAAQSIPKLHESAPNLMDWLTAKKIALIINTPLGRHSQHDDSGLRIAALQYKIPYTTTTSAAEAAVEGIIYEQRAVASVRPLEATLKRCQSI